MRVLDLASLLLRSIRHTTAFSQRGLAARARCRAASIADIERGAHDPTVARLDHLLGVTGHRLAVLPTRSRPVSEAAETIAGCLAQGQESTAFREVIQLSDDLARERGAVRVALTATPPRFMGDARWDALVAGVTEYWLDLDDLTQPEWLEDSRRVSGEAWYVDGTAPREELEAATPAALARRRVFLALSELLSV